MRHRRRRWIAVSERGELYRTGDSSVAGRWQLRRAQCLVFSVLVVSLLVSSLPVSTGVCSPARTTKVAAERPEFEGANSLEWAQRLTAERRETRTRAERRLVAGGEAALAVLLALLQFPYPDVQKRASDYLARLGKKALPGVLVLATDPNSDTRYYAVCVFRDLGEDAAPAVELLGRLLSDKDARVAMESARALALIGPRAAPAVRRLQITARTHRYGVVRVMACGALTSIGSAAAPATHSLAEAVMSDDDPRVRRAAAEALAAIGPRADGAVLRLREALTDKDIFVRIATMGALGAIGGAARPAVPQLRELRSQAALRSEANWALEQITGRKPEPTESVVSPPSIPSEPRPEFVPKTSWTMHCGRANRNAISDAVSIPTDFKVNPRRHLRWVRELGDVTYGGPVIAGDKVFVGTGYDSPDDSNMPPGLLYALDRETGKILWRDDAPRVVPGLSEFLIPQTTSSPLVEGERLYYLTSMGQLRCLDTEGFRDGENDGAIVDERRTTRGSADHIWELDLVTQVGVFIHEAPNCSVVSVGDVLLVCTGNGVCEAHTNVPAPRAPSFIGVDKRNGSVLWRVVGPSPRVLHGQWSSPSVVNVSGRVLALFGGGDGWLYALDPTNGREVWRYDGNPKDAVWRTSGDVRGRTARNNIIASPVVADGVVYLAMGQDPEHGGGRGRLHAIDPGGAGDVTDNRGLWQTDRIGRVIASPIIHDGLIYVGDYNGYVHCLDRADGATVWTHDVLAGIWGAMLIADRKLFVGDEDGVLTAFRLGREKEILGRTEFDAPIWGAPAAVDDVLYVSTARRLYAFRSKTRRLR